MLTQANTGGTLKRRGILAAAGAVVAGIVAKQASQPVAASTPMLIANIETVGVSNTVIGPTTIASAVGYNSHGAVFIANGNAGLANAGLHGTLLPVATPPTELCGVYGEGSSHNGVLGYVGGGGTGVKGISATGYGVMGQVPNTFSSNGSIAVNGVNSAPGTNNHGVVGQSATGYGVLGYTTGGSASLSGISTDVNIPAFAGGNSVAGGLAASFAGTVYVNGMFVVADMTQKHGLLKHPDGSHRLMYTVEAPESWAEDFGTGHLIGGRAEINIEPDFAALIQTADYHVFITEHAHHHLAVTQRGTGGFVVEADTDLAQSRGKQASQLSGTFSWRVVAKPKSDHRVERLGRFTVPNVPLPDVTKLPKPSEPAKPPTKP